MTAYWCQTLYSAVLECHSHPLILSLPESCEIGRIYISLFFDKMTQVKLRKYTELVSVEQWLAPMSG